MILETWGKNTFLNNYILVREFPEEGIVGNLIPLLKSRGDLVNWAFFQVGKI